MLTFLFLNQTLWCYHSLKSSRRDDFNEGHRRDDFNEGHIIGFGWEMRKLSWKQFCNYFLTVALDTCLFQHLLSKSCGGFVVLLSPYVTNSWISLKCHILSFFLNNVYSGISNSVYALIESSCRSFLISVYTVCKCDQCIIKKSIMKELPLCNTQVLQGLWQTAWSSFAIIANTIKCTLFNCNRMIPQYFS